MSATKELSQQQADAIFNAAGSVANDLLKALKTGSMDAEYGEMEPSNPIIINAKVALEKNKNLTIGKNKHIVVYLQCSNLESDELDTSKYREITPVMQACGYLAYAVKTAFACLVHQEKGKVFDVLISSIGLILDDATNTIIPVYVSPNEVEQTKLTRCVNALLTQREKLEECDKQTWVINWTITQEKIKICEKAIADESVKMAELNAMLRHIGHVALRIEEMSIPAIEKRFSISCGASCTKTPEECGADKPCARTPM